MESPDPNQRRARRGNYRRAYRIAGSVLLALTIGAATLTFILVERWESATRTPSALDGTDAAGDGISPFTATMYYVAADGRGLVRREIEIPYATDTLSRARIIAERQLERAPRQLLSPFPRGTRLRSIYLADDGILFVDLSAEVTTEHSGWFARRAAHGLRSRQRADDQRRRDQRGSDSGGRRRGRYAGGPHRPAPAADPEPDVGRRPASRERRSGSPDAEPGDALDSTAWSR